MLTISKLAKEVKTKIYTRIQEEHEGEIKENEFNELIQDIRHEELDYKISVMCICNVNDYLCEYGIQEAFQFYMDSYGFERDIPSIRCVLYHIIDESINLSFSNYLNYCHHCNESIDESDE